MSSIEDRCLDALREAWRRGVASPRSTKKLDVLHGWIKDELLRELPSELPNYEIQGKTTIEDDQFSSEKKIEGKYYQKKTDLTIVRNGHEVGIISVKLIQSSYKKNAINYFEQQLGETANLRGSGLVYGNVIFIPHPIPVRIKGVVERTEHVTDAALYRYRKLVSDYDNIVIPDVQAIVITNLDVRNNNITHLAKPQDLDHLNDETKEFLFQKVHIRKFVKDYAQEIDTKYRQRMN